MEETAEDWKNRLWSLDDLQQFDIHLEIERDKNSIYRDIRFLGLKVVRQLFEIKKNDRNDYQKLRKSLSRLMQIPSLSMDGRQFVRGNTEITRDIIEIKAKNGKSRVLAFEDGEQLIIVSNVYWKTTDHRAPQDLAFQKAARLRAEYFQERSRFYE